MSKIRARPRRVYQPRPSPAARSTILNAVGALLGDPLLGGYAVRPRHLAGILAPSLTVGTVRAYLPPLRAGGALEQPAPGCYTLPGAGIRMPGAIGRV